MDIPDNIKPECWRDDERMNAMLAPFRSRNLDLTAYDSKLKFWCNIIENWCLQSESCAVTYADLLGAIKRNGKTPACLEMVFDHLIRSGQLVEVNKFIQSLSESWTGWAVNLVKTPITWSYQKVKEVIVKHPNTDTVSFVHVSVLKESSKTALDKIPEKSKGIILTFTQLQNIVGMNNKTTLQLILCQLKQSNQAATVRENDEELIKIKNPSDKTVRISELDLNVYRLQQNETVLSEHISKLKQEIENAVNDARKHVRNNNKILAKSCLRKKKELEKFIEKRACALDNVRHLIFRIQQAESDAKVIECYKLGINTLKTTFIETGLTEENVNDTMDDLVEVLDIHKEMEAALSRSIDPAVDADLEDELEMLLSEPSEAPPAAPSGGFMNKPNQEISGDLENKFKDLHILDLPDPPTKEIGTEQVSV